MRTKLLATTAATLAVSTAVGGVSAATAAPTASAARTKVRVFVRTGVSVHCPRGRACTITVHGETAASAGRMVDIGQSTIRLPPATTTKLVFTLNPAGVRLIHANTSLAVKLTIAVRQEQHRPILVTHTVVVAGLKK